MASAIIIVIGGRKAMEQTELTFKENYSKLQENYVFLDFIVFS